MTPEDENEMLEGLGVVERAMAQRASRNAEVIGIAEDAGCEPLYVAAMAVRAIMVRSVPPRT
jgi:hypothetical protein